MTMTFDTISEPLPARIRAGLSKIALVERHEAWVHDGSQGLTPTQGEVLSLLHVRGSLPVSGIARELAVEQPTASDAVSALERKGFIGKEKAPHDRRVRQIVLTEAGRAIARAKKTWADTLQEVVDELSENEKSSLLKTITKVIRSLQERGTIPVQHMCINCVYFRPNVYGDGNAPHHCAYVNAAFGDRHLRIDCPEYQEADADFAYANWKQFTRASGEERS